MPSDNRLDMNDKSHHGASGVPPRSPHELDERIISHARAKAEEYAKHSRNPGYAWLGGSWKTAVAVLSVAVIGISVTLQVYDDSRTTPFSPSRAIPDAEVADADINDTMMPASTDSPTQSTSARQQRAVETTDTVSGVAFRAAERPPQAQPESLSAQVTESVPGLPELLSNIDSLASTAPSLQDSATSGAEETLDSVLSLIESVFSGVSMALAPAQQNDSVTDVERLESRARALLAAYRNVESAEERVQLAAGYRQQRQLFQSVDLPPTLALTMTVLQNWLSNR